MALITWECGVPGCGYTSPKKRARDLHIRVKHRPRQFKCDLLDRRGKLCSSEFAKESQLRYHVKLVHTPTEELKYACNYAGCGKRFFSAAKLQSHVTTHERKEQRQKAEIEKAELQEGLIFDLNENPCSPWLKEINKLRLAERNRIPELETEEIIPREFSSYMMKQVQGYNEAMIRKFPDRPCIPCSTTTCKGPEHVQDIQSCPFEVEINNSTTQLGTKDIFKTNTTRKSVLTLYPLCVYCNAAKATALTHNYRAEKDPELCSATQSCTNQRLEGQRWCHEHHDERRAREPSEYIWKNSLKDKYRSSKATGPCREITTFEQMAHYLESQRGRNKMSGIWKILKDMELQKSELLFHVDVEFAGSYLIEIGIENAAGTVVIDTLVTYDKTWAQIYAEGDGGTNHWMDQQKDKFKWNANWEFPAETKTMNALEVAKCLEQAGTYHPDAKFLEFTNGNSDLQHIHTFLDSADNDYGWILGGHIGIGFLQEWKRKLPGFWHVGQSLLFQLMHPDHPLASQSHRALLDARKMHLLFKDMVDDSAQD